MRRRTLLVMLMAVAALALNGCTDEPNFRVGDYPVVSTPPITPSRTFTDGKGLRYLVDDDAKCVQIDAGGGTSSDCVPFEQPGAQAVMRAGNHVIALLIVGDAPTQTSPGVRLVATWFTPLHDREPDAVNAIELATGVYAVAYRSPVDVPIWGVQVRAEDGRLVEPIAIAGQFINAPR